VSPDYLLLSLLVYPSVPASSQVWITRCEDHYDPQPVKRGSKRVMMMIIIMIEVFIFKFPSHYVWYLCMLGVTQTPVNTWESAHKISTSLYATVVIQVTQGQCATSVSILLSINH